VHAVSGILPYVLRPALLSILAIPTLSLEVVISMGTLA